MELDRLTYESWSAIKSPVLRVGLLNGYMQAFRDSSQGIETALDNWGDDSARKVDACRRECKVALESMDMAHRYMDDSNAEVATYYKQAGLYDDMHDLMRGVALDKEAPPSQRKVAVGFLSRELSRAAPSEYGEAAAGFLQTLQSVLAEGENIKDGKAVFYEMMMLVEREDSIVLRLKHFNPDFTGWEEKDKSVDFKFVNKSGSRMNFSGLTFEKVSGDKLNIYLALKQKDGSVKEEVFSMTRMK